MAALNLAAIRGIIATSEYDTNEVRSLVEQMTPTVILAALKIAHQNGAIAALLEIEYQARNGVQGIMKEQEARQKDTSDIILTETEITITEAIDFLAEQGIDISNSWMRIQLIAGHIQGQKKHGKWITTRKALQNVQQPRRRGGKRSTAPTTKPTAK